MTHSDPLDGSIREALADVVSQAPIAPDFDDITASSSGQQKRPMRPIAWAAAAVVAVVVAGVALAGTDDTTVDTGMAAQDSEEDGSAATRCEQAVLRFAADESNVIVFLQPDSTGDQQDDVARAIQGAPEVEVVRFVDQQATYDEFRDLFVNSPELVESVTADILPPRFELRVAGSSPSEAITGVLGTNPAVREIIAADLAMAEMVAQCEAQTHASAGATPTTTIATDDGQEPASGADPSASSGSDEQALDERCEMAKAPYGPGAEVIAAFESTGDFEAVCWIDGSVAKSPPGGDPFDRAVVGIRSDGTSTLIKAGYQSSMQPEAP